MTRSKINEAGGPTSILLGAAIAIKTALNLYIPVVTKVSQIEWPIWAGA